MASEELLAEAYKRNLLPPDKRAMYEELQKHKPPGAFDFAGNVDTGFSQGWEEFKRGFTPEAIHAGASEIFPEAPADIAGGLYKMASAVPSAIWRAGVTGPIEKGTGGLLTEENVNTALMGAGVVGGPARLAAIEGRPRPPILGGRHLRFDELENTRFERRHEPIPPTREELDAAATAARRDMAAEHVDLQADVVGALSNRIVNSLNAAGFRDYDPEIGPVYRAVRELEAPEDATTTSTADIDAVRGVLNRMATNPRRVAAARHAIEMIDDYIDNIPGLSEAERAHRGNYAAARRSERLTTAVEEGTDRAAASGSGANTVNALRQRVAGILRSPRLSRGLSDQERQFMREIVRGTTLINLARLASKFGPQHPLSGWGVGLSALFTGHLDAGILATSLGHISQRYAERATERLLVALDEMIRMRSPLGTERAATAAVHERAGHPLPPPPGRTAIGAPIAATWGTMQGGRGTRDDPHRFGGTPQQMEQQFNALPPGSYFVNPRDNTLLQKPPPGGL